MVFSLFYFRGKKAEEGTQEKDEIPELRLVVEPYSVVTLSSTDTGYVRGVSLSPSSCSVEPSNKRLLASDDKELSQGSSDMQTNSLFLTNDIQQTASSTSSTLDGRYCLKANSLHQTNYIQNIGYSTSGALDGFVMSENRDVSVSAENSFAVPDTAALFDTSNNSLIASGVKELSLNRYVLEANSLFQSNDIQQTVNSTSDTLDCFAMSENRDVSVSAEISVAVPDTAALFDTSKNTLIASGDKELSLNRYVLEANSLFQSNDVQQTGNSISGTLDGFVMSETMNVSDSERNSAAVSDTTALFEKFIIYIIYYLFI
ncbi:hypothetical protein AVEN_61484-1 [Araneus ventricosus]|uniref:Uncharacterized protein n=1 Tax=Araneus ventricosus TaxID=182803 RepID=A0A4Y2AIY0_ARAVE|nr:hypothetical protein AVEN_61484-1 [Araneus ventricosus]